MEEVEVSEQDSAIRPVPVDEPTSTIICADCDELDPQWLSVSHGIWICLKCSQAHRDLGDHISLVKSEVTDELTEIQKKLIADGGNEAMQEWFDKFEIAKTEEIGFKYRTKAAKQYRERLMASALGEDYEIIEISPEEGKELIEEEAPEIDQSMLEKASGYIENKYADAVKYGNETIAALDEWGATNETMVNMEKRAMGVMDGIAGAMQAGIVAAPRMFNTVMSYTPLGCLGIGTALGQEEGPRDVELQQKNEEESKN